jgi:hypothetical protein
VDHFRENGSEVETSTGDDRVRLTLRHGGRTWSVALTRHGEDATPLEDIIVQLHGRPSAAYGGTWFALLERVRSGPNSDVAREISDFIERYGVRFAPLGEA